MEVTIWLRIKSKGLKRKKKKNPGSIRNNISVYLLASCDVIAEKEFRGQDGV